MKNSIRKIGVIVSLIAGLNVEAVIYYVFGINPAYLPIGAIIGLWLAVSMMIACVVDEFIRRKYKVRLYRRFAER